ncbi:phosphatase PAP2 family protein [Marixanthomonas sp. SCSIO 43207]|uniref:phosphatase PAP2 family protein n=1 Tax=Marixanthomonas sp. SCSIO 43207 TaxID=2779360 RepID=UPI001CA85E8F|nr:phosphatase PAP2 family protein [Marixanthomonas sp. SCSIO 43207]UAB81412.1 phosphatase PAP2 family protein [Marixanthomonas sp. SCSIO 43207]
MFEILKEWDRELFVFLNSLGIKQFDDFWITVTQIETWTPLFLLFTFLIFYYFKWKRGGAIFFFLLLTFGITIFVTGEVKNYFERLRPNNVESLSEIIRILQKPSNYSFFSGHASSSFSITTFMVLVLREKTKWVYLFFLWPLIFVTSRIYVGVHYPSDIFVGALVGTVFAFLFYKLCKLALKHDKLSVSDLT